MPGPAGRAEQLVRQLQQALKAADPLTQREHEIAELVLAGLSNRTELAAWALRARQRPDVSAEFPTELLGRS